MSSETKKKKKLLSWCRWMERGEKEVRTRSLIHGQSEREKIGGEKTRESTRGSKYTRNTSPTIIWGKKKERKSTTSQQKNKNKRVVFPHRRRISHVILFIKEKRITFSKIFFSQVPYFHVGVATQIDCFMVVVAVKSFYF